MCDPITPQGKKKFSIFTPLNAFIIKVKEMKPQFPELIISETWDVYRKHELMSAIC